MSRELDWTVDRHSWPNSATSRFVVVDGVRWHVQVMGRGPALLLLHGTAASTHSWRGLAPLLSEAFTVVAPDLPGHGFTQGADGSAMTLPGMADGIRRLLAHLGFEPVVAAGHSAGAAILVRMCLDGMIAPRHLIALNGAILPFQPALGSMLSPMAKVMVANPFAKRMITWHARDLRNVARLFQSYAHVSGAITMMASWDLDTLQGSLTELETPITLVAGEHDLSVPLDRARQLSRTFRDARVIALRSVGHLAHEERPAKAAEVILQYAKSETRGELAPAA